MYLIMYSNVISVRTSNHAYVLRPDRRAAHAARHAPHAHGPTAQTTGATRPTWPRSALTLTAHVIESQSHSQSGSHTRREAI